MNFKPLSNRIVVKPDQEMSITAGGIYLPDQAKEKPVAGTVVSVGAGKRLENGMIIPVQVNAGDHIIYNKWAGTEITIDGENLLIMLDSDVLGVL